MKERSEHTRSLRDRFEKGVQNRIDEVVFNGNREQRLPNISDVSFRFIEGEGLLINLDMQGIAVSTGSACSSGSLEPSPVIRALGHNDELARGSIRFSYGKDNSEEDVVYLLDVLPRCVEKLRGVSPLYSRVQSSAFNVQGRGTIVDLEP
jgi:cysteine desulfurase